MIESGSQSDVPEAEGVAGNEKVESPPGRSGVAGNENSRKKVRQGKHGDLASLYSSARSHWSDHKATVSPSNPSASSNVNISRRPPSRRVNHTRDAAPSLDLLGSPKHSREVRVAGNSASL